MSAQHERPWAIYDRGFGLLTLETNERGVIATFDRSHRGLAIRVAEALNASTLPMPTRLDGEDAAWASVGKAIVPPAESLRLIPLDSHLVKSLREMTAHIDSIVRRRAKPNDWREISEALDRARAVLAQIGAQP